MGKTAVLIDGGFFKKRSAAMRGRMSASDLADFAVSYALAHLTHGAESLYRIFYYDCLPSNFEGHYPVSKKNVKFSNSTQSKFQYDFIEALKSKRKVAIRLGELHTTGKWQVRPITMQKILDKKIKLDELKDEDYVLNLSQKGVDMRMGLDIASLAYKKQVEQIVLISGDSDFVPAAKLARREGIDFILDPMGARIKPSLHEHVDGIISPPVPSK